MTSFLDYAAMKEKHEFMIEDVPLVTNSDRAQYLARQILMEGVNLFASFAMLLSFAQQGKLPGMVSVNQWSILDESLHVRGLCELFAILIAQDPKIITADFKKGIYETARRIVAMEDAFIDLCFSVGNTSTATAQEYKDHIRVVCDHRMQQMGLKGQFGIKESPLEWMDLITTATLGSFFETSVVQYSKDNLAGEWTY